MVASFQVSKVPRPSLSRSGLRLDALEQLAGFLGRQHGRLAFSDDVFGAAHGVGGVHLQNVAGHQPVKEHTQRGQVLLDGGRGERSLQILDEGGDVEGLHVGEPGDAAALAPGVEAPRGAQVGPARVVVVDLGGEKLQDAPGGLGRRGEQGRGLKRACRREDESGARGRDSGSVEAGV